MKTTIVALTLMAFSGGAAAQINKCLDASGKVVGYGNECPAGTRSEASGVKVSPPPAPAKSVTAADNAAKSDKGAKAAPESAADAKIISKHSFHYRRSLISQHAAKRKSIN